MRDGFEPVIGLEVHCQLATKSKLFSPAQANPKGDISVSEIEPNSQVNQICAGHPGTLPVLNKKAIDFAIRAGHATGCTIREKSVFARKNYFYPDLPKGYQISQHNLPLCEKGVIEIRLKEQKTKKIRIQRIHVEEDAGKNIHMEGFSLVNLNRAGVPLIEIVTEPDIRTAEEAGDYLRELHRIVTYLGICDGNLQEGNFRCDANVSVRPVGTEKLGTRAEIKNVNSFRFIEKAIEYEIDRQIEVIKSGNKVAQETRTYDSAKGITISMRSKEEAHDYRYFPDPDLPALIIEKEWIEQIRASLPELPTQKRTRYINEWKLSDYDADVLAQTKEMAEFFERAVDVLIQKKQEPAKSAKLAANLLTGEISRLLNDGNEVLSKIKVKSIHIADLVEKLILNEISSTAARMIIGEIWVSGKEVEKIIEEKGLRQVSDKSELEKYADQVIDQNPEQAADYRNGKEKLLGFFVGQTMKLTKGKANPAFIKEIIEKKLKK